MILLFSLGFAIAVLVWAVSERRRLKPRTSIVVFADSFFDGSPSVRRARARAAETGCGTWSSGLLLDSGEPATFGDTTLTATSTPVYSNSTLPPT